MITPDSTAEAGAGATGWAVGSHPCMGNMPALVEKPRIMRNTAVSWIGLRASRVRLPPGVKAKVSPWDMNRKKPNRVRNAPPIE